MIRKIVLDTETTGLDYKEDRIFEIACIEMLDYESTGNEFHYYLNPRKRLSKESILISGVKDEFLTDKPFFESIVDELLNFIKDDIIVAHNAQFDINMINSELERIGRPPLKNKTIDTLTMAREVYPGGNNSLDSLNKKLKININRPEHSAKKDTEILSLIYFYLSNLHGGLNTVHKVEKVISFNDNVFTAKTRINPSTVTSTEYQSHMEFCEKYKVC